MKLAIKILALVIMVGFIAYFGMCVYSNYFAPDVAENDYNAPSAKEAAYSLVVKNTATVILTNDCEVFGSELGSRTFYLDGYWELSGGEFKYRDSTLTLSEQVFGRIDYRRRD